MRSNLSDHGFTVVASPTGLQETLLEISSCLVQLIGGVRKTHREDGAASDIATLHELLGVGATRNDDVAHEFVEHVLRTAHQSIAQIRNDLIPALARVAQSLGVDAETGRAIARFRIASDSRLEYDHLWHQDSVDPAFTSKRQRTSILGFWIPLHDVSTEEGAIEISVGSHFKPIPHTEADAYGRLYFPEEQVGAYKKYIVPMCFGDVLALDPWIAHRTVRNSCGRVRIALLTWF